jgi:O-antigen ligase
MAGVRPRWPLPATQSIWLHHLPIVALYVAVIHPGSAAALSVLLALFLAVVRWRRLGDLRLQEPIVWLVIVSATYSAGLLLHDWFVTGDPLGAFSAGKTNLLFFFIALLFLLARPEIEAFDRIRLSNEIAILGVSIGLICTLLWLARRWDLIMMAAQWDELTVFEYQRVRLFARNPLMLATLYLGVSFLGCSWFSAKSGCQRLVAVVGLLSCPFVLYLTMQARGALLTYLLLLVLVLWYVGWRRLSVATAGALMFGSMSIAVYIASDAVRDRLSGSGSLIVQTLEKVHRLTVDDPSVVQRIEMYRRGLEVGFAGPLIGHGYQNRFDAAFIPSASGSATAAHGHLHNVFIDHWVAAGVPGLLGFCLVWLFPLLMSRGKKPPADRDFNYLAWMFGLLVAGVGMTTEVTGHYVHTTFLGLLLAIIVLGKSPARAPPVQSY